MTKRTLRACVRRVLTEQNVGSVYADVVIRVRVSLNAHAEDQRFRHDDEITTGDIVDTCQRAARKIVHYLLHGSLGIGDPFVVRDARSTLNIVGVIDATGDPDTLDMTVVTVMRKRNFKPRRDTVPIDIE